MKKKITALILSLAFILSLLPATSFAAEGMAIAKDVSGSFFGATRNVLNIYTAEEFKTFAGNVSLGNTYENYDIFLKADIDTSYYFVGHTDAPFKGRFYGEGHTVTVNIQLPYGIPAGLFVYTSGATISDLKVTGSVAGSSLVGGVAGRADNTTFINCENNAYISYYDIGILSSAYSFYFGGIVGYMVGGTAENCVNNGTVGPCDKADGMGGIAGFASNAYIKNCTNNGRITTAYSFIGGIAGYLGSSTVVECLNAGEISGTMYVGGIVGCNYNSRIASTKNEGKVICADEFAGGIAGEISYGCVTRSENAGEVIYSPRSGTVYFSTPGIYIGGIAGYVSGTELSFVINRGSVTGAADVAGIVGAAFDDSNVIGVVNYGKVTGTVQYNFYAGICGDLNGSVARLMANYGTVKGYNSAAGLVFNAGNGASVSAGLSAGEEITDVESGYISKSGFGYDTSESKGGIFTSWDDDEIMLKKLNDFSDDYGISVWGYDDELRVVPIFTNGYGSEKTPYVISNIYQLKMLADSVNSGKKLTNGDGTLYYTLAEDIVDEDAVMSPIGNYTNPFTGRFNGNGKKVFLKMKRYHEDAIGLFGSAVGAVIRDLSVAGFVGGKVNVGGICGLASSGTVIYNCQTDAKIDGSRHVGGIVGAVDGVGCVIVNCIDRGDVDAGTFAAGIVGYISRPADTCVQRCFVLGSITATAGYSDAVYSGSPGFATAPNTYILSDFTDAESKVAFVSTLYEEDFTEEIQTCALEYTRVDVSKVEYFYLPEFIDGILCFDIFNDEQDFGKTADVWYPGVAADIGKAGHKEYFYKYADGKYYENYECTRAIKKLDDWMSKPTGKGYIAPLKAEKVYSIDGHNFGSRSDAEAYLKANYDKGITAISLGGDISTSFPVYIAPHTKLTVNLNGYSWTYNGFEDDATIFYTNSNDTVLEINGDTEKVINGVIEDLEEEKVNVYAYGTEDMGTIGPEDGYTARLFTCPGSMMELNYVRVLGTNTEGKGGMFYGAGPSKIEINYSVIEGSVSVLDGGAIYIDREAAFDYNRVIKSTGEALKQLGGFGSEVDIRLDHSAFVDCMAFGGNGGAICARCDDCDISGDGTSGFINCSSRNRAGGAISLFEINDNASGLNVDDLYFYKCFCGDSCSMPILNANHNTAMSGGAISIDASYMKISDCDFEFCLAGGNGGALDVAGNHWPALFWGTDRIALEGLTFKNCNAVELGKDIYFSSHIGLLKDIALIDNGNYRLIGDGYENPSARICLFHNGSRITLNNVAITDNHKTASVLSAGSIIAIVAIAAAAVIITVLLVVKKKKNKAK